MSGHINEEEIALLAGNDLGAEAAHEFSRHIASCPDCATRLAAYCAGRQSMAALRETGIGAGEFDVVRQSVLQRIDRERVSHHQFGMLQWGALAAALLIAVGAGTWWWKSAPSPGVVETSRPAAPAQEERVPVPLENRMVPTTQPPANQASAMKPAKRPRVEMPKPAIQPFAPAINIAEQGSSPAHQPVALDDVVMKLETSDPNVIIIWLASPKGAGR